MAEQLTTEQILLLNNLMYMTNDEPFQSIDDAGAKTIRAYIERIQTSKIDEDADYGSYMTGEDWKNIIAAVKNDEQLMNMKIAETHVDSENGGGGLSAVFVDSGTNEAVVTFRGTMLMCDKVTHKNLIGSSRYPVKIISKKLDFHIDFFRFGSYTVLRTNRKK